MVPPKEVNPNGSRCVLIIPSYDSFDLVRFLIHIGWRARGGLHKSEESVAWMSSSATFSAAGAAFFFLVFFVLELLCLLYLFIPTFLYLRFSAYFCSFDTLFLVPLLFCLFRFLWFSFSCTFAFQFFIPLLFSVLSHHGFILGTCAFLFLALVPSYFRTFRLFHASLLLPSSPVLK